jgi:arylsulfatase A-like enzyme
LEWKPDAGVFPGHAAWLDHGWKLHRIENKKTGAVRWELYHLDQDAQEANDLSQTQPQRVARMRESLEGWLTSVTDSLKGEDYR